MFGDDYRSNAYNFQSGEALSDSKTDSKRTQTDSDSLRAPAKQLKRFPYFPARPKNHQYLTANHRKILSQPLSSLGAYHELVSNHLSYFGSGLSESESV